MIDSNHSELFIKMVEAICEDLSALKTREDWMKCLKAEKEQGGDKKLQTTQSNFIPGKEKKKKVEII